MSAPHPKLASDLASDLAPERELGRAALRSRHRRRSAALRSRRRRRIDLAFLSALLLLGALLWAPRLSGPIDLRFDAGVYYLLGTSLANGEGYRLPNEPGAPQAVQYPPLLPAVVAVHQWAWGTDDVAVVGEALRWTFCAVFLLYGVTLYALARRLLSPAAAFAAAAITLLYPYTYFLADLLFTELPFSLAVVLFFLAAGRRRPRWWSDALACLAAGAAFLLRTAGVALLVAWVVEGLLARRWKQAGLRACLALALVGGWQGYVAEVRASREYTHPAYPYQRASYQYYNVPYGENALLVDPFRPELGRAGSTELAVRSATNLGLMVPSLGEGITAGAPWWMWLFQRAQERTLGSKLVPAGAVWAPIAVVAALVLLGLALWVRRGRLLIPLYVGASLGLISLTPWPSQFTRYLAPVTPFLAIALLLALTHLARSRRPRRGPLRRAQRALPVAVVAVVAGVQTFSALQAHRLRVEEGRALDIEQAAAVLARGEALDLTATRTGAPLFFYDASWAAHDACLAWVRAHAEQDAVIATTAPHWTTLHTGRLAVLPPMEADVALEQRLLESVADYLVLDTMDFLDVGRRYAAPAVAAHPERWERVFTAPGGGAALYRLRR